MRRSKFYSQHVATTADQSAYIISRSTINVLPGDVLLEIFDFYVDESWRNRPEPWHLLVHVCRSWRNLILASPRHLNLRLFCTPRTPVRTTLGVWPPFPIVLDAGFHTESGEDNIMATLEHTDRVCQIGLWKISSSLWGEVLPASQEPFPTLTDLDLGFTDELASVVPDSFLRGSAPRLRRLFLDSVPFPGL